MSEIQMEHLSERLARRNRVTGGRADRAASARPARRSRGGRLPLWIGLTVALVASLLLWGLVLAGVAQLIARLSLFGPAQ